jgi:tRNA (guanine26-N2/guanine27-N2)-dimethyltransferase
VTGDTSGSEVSYLDAMSASGIRSLRMSKEVPGLTSVVANDLSPKATETIKLNLVWGLKGSKF